MPNITLCVIGHFFIKLLLKNGLKPLKGAISQKQHLAKLLIINLNFRTIQKGIVVSNICLTNNIKYKNENY